MRRIRFIVNLPESSNILNFLVFSSWIFLISSNFFSKTWSLSVWSSSWELSFHNLVWYLWASSVIFLQNEEIFPVFLWSFSLKSIPWLSPEMVSSSHVEPPGTQTVGHHPGQPDWHGLSASRDHQTFILYFAQIYVWYVPFYELSWCWLGSLS